jgi:hypothetical protein
VELKKAAMRKVLSRRRDAVFTYSNDYMSLNFPMVDPFRIAQVRCRAHSLASSQERHKKV